MKKVRTSSQPQFALVTGEAGIGKSRLVFELLRYVEHRPWIVRWRQGRCPAYGEGLTFWALAEIFKEQLGVVERDEVATVEAKLAHALAGVDDREWLTARLRPLLGLEGAATSREENFAAWRRFLEIIATDCPAVVVFEDLHWASEATLAFLRHLVENVGEVPLLLIGTARPELLHAQPDMAAHLAELGSSQRVVRIDLEPLTESETEELVVRVGRGLTELAEANRAITERSAGNPLFVEQLVRHLEGESDVADRPADAAPGGAAGGALLKETVARALPESLQSLIAARLDELPPARKTLLGDAAVVGEVFWTSAVAALDHDDHGAAEAALHDLTQRDLVRPHVDSSLAGENEFAFSHGLIRDVAYAQLTRTDRAAKHAAVARWLEETAGERETRSPRSWRTITSLLWSWPRQPATSSCGTSCSSPVSTPWSWPATAHSRSTSASRSATTRGRSTSSVTTPCDDRACWRNGAKRSLRGRPPAGRRRRLRRSSQRPAGAGPAQERRHGYGALVATCARCSTQGTGTHLFWRRRPDSWTATVPHRS